MKGYQPRTNMVQDEKGDLVTDSHNILARWRNHFCQLLSVREVNGGMHNGGMRTELHKVEPLMPKPSTFEVEISIEKLKIHISPGIDQIRAELIKVGGRKI